MRQAGVRLNASAPRKGDLPTTIELGEKAYHTTDDT